MKRQQQGVLRRSLGRPEEKKWADTSSQVLALLNFFYSHCKCHGSSRTCRLLYMCLMSYMLPPPAKGKNGKKCKSDDSEQSKASDPKEELIQWKGVSAEAAAVVLHPGAGLPAERFGIVQSEPPNLQVDHRDQAVHCAKLFARRQVDSSVAPVAAEGTEKQEAGAPIALSMRHAIITLLVAPSTREGLKILKHIQ